MKRTYSVMDLNGVGKQHARSLLLHIIIEKFDIPNIEASGKIPLRYVARTYDHMALCENWQDAFDWFAYVNSKLPNPSEHCGLTFSITASGLDRFMMGVEDFSAILSDREVWYCRGDLILRGENSDIDLWSSSKYVDLNDIAV